MWLHPVLPLVALALVGAIDGLLAWRAWPIVVHGALDESAHLLTALVLLAALLPARLRHLLPWALLGIVAIDVDHLPLYFWGVGAAAGSGRPVTHSLLTIAVLLGGAALLRRLRAPLAGLAVGVALHLVRDLATGPGVPLLWPLSDTAVTAPYAGYLGVLAIGTAAAVVRRRRAALSA